MGIRIAAAGGVFAELVVINHVGLIKNEKSLPPLKTERCKQPYRYTRELKGLGTSQTSKYVFGVFAYLSYRFHTNMNNRGA